MMDNGVPPGKYMSQGRAVLSHVSQNSVLSCGGIARSKQKLFTLKGYRKVKATLRASLFGSFLRRIRNRGLELRSRRNYCVARLGDRPYCEVKVNLCFTLRGCGKVKLANLCSRTNPNPFRSCIKSKAQARIASDKLTVVTCCNHQSQSMSFFFFFSHLIVSHLASPHSVVLLLTVQHRVVSHLILQQLVLSRLILFSTRLF